MTDFRSISHTCDQFLTFRTHLLQHIGMKKDLSAVWEWKTVHFSCKTVLFVGNFLVLRVRKPTGPLHYRRPLQYRPPWGCLKAIKSPGAYNGGNTVIIERKKAMEISYLFVHLGLAVLSGFGGAFHIFYCCLFYAMGSGVVNAALLVVVAVWGLYR